MMRPAYPRSLLCPASRRWLRHQRTTRVPPAEWMGKYSMEIFDKIRQFITQVFHRGERTTANHFPPDHPEDHLDLVQPRTVLRRVHEPDAVTGLRPERLAARHRSQHTTYPLLAQRRGDLTGLGHHPHQGLRTMAVQVIRYEHPRRTRVNGHRLLDVAGEVGLGTRRADRGSDQLPGRHLEVADQGQ